MKKSPKIEMLSTGNEVLYGQIVDTNAAWFSDFLFQEGYEITSRFTVGDNLKQLIETLQNRTKINDILIVNGGLGPTSDDLSAEAAAKANNEELVLHEEWVKVMEDYFASRGRVMPPANIKQAMLPKSALIVDNPVGTACGFKMIINECLVFFTPGVPSEFKQMVKLQILPEIQQQYPQSDKPICYRLTTMGRTESDLATEIESKLNVPEGIDVGYRSAMPIIELKLIGSTSQKQQMDKLWLQLKSLVSTNTVYEGDNSFARVVTEKLQKQALSLIVVEQKTAGLLAYQLYQANAPLIKSEVIASPVEDLPAYLLALAQKRDALVLAVTDFNVDNSQFTLSLTTADKHHQYRLKYISRRYNQTTEQQIFSAIALDTLSRYLDKADNLIGPNVWLEVLA